MRAGMAGQKVKTRGAEPSRIHRQSDLAARLGISTITVSRALRGTGLVRVELAEKILNAAREYGYSEEANFTARALRERRNGKHVATRAICAIARNAVDFAGPFNVRLLNGIKRGAEQAGDELLIVLGGPDRLPRVVLRRQVDGVIWILSESEMKNVSGAGGVPMVGVLFAVTGADAVTADDHGAMRAMGEYLARKGHRRVAFVGTDSELGRARLAGLRAGLAGAGGRVDDGDVQMRPYVMLPDTVVPLVRAVMTRRQTLPPAERFTAIAAYNDYIAVTVLRCLQDEYGLRVPRDMSVTGFDGLDLQAGAGPKLTTAAMPLEEIGAEAVRTINWRMENRGEPPRRVVLPAPLVEGETVSVIGDR